MTFAQTPAARDIIKCIIAYFISSLFTFNPTLSSLIYDVSGEGSGPSPSGHMVATMCVFRLPRLPSVIDDHVLQRRLLQSRENHRSYDGS